MESLPVWLLLLKVHLDELRGNRQYGRRVAEALLDQLHKVGCFNCLERLTAYKWGPCPYESNPAIQIQFLPYADTYGPVRVEILNIIKYLVASHPAFFLLPWCWYRHQSTLRALVDNTQTILRTQFDNINERNLQLEKGMSDLSDGVGICPRSKVVQFLDGLCNNVDISQAANAGLRMCSNPALLIKTCLQWSSSMYRSGHTRVYLATRLLRKWSRKKINLEHHILNFMSDESNIDALHRRDLFRVLAELIRSRHFSVNKYLQWLIANGLLNDRNKQDKVCRLFVIQS